MAVTIDQLLTQLNDFQVKRDAAAATAVAATAAANNLITVTSVAQGQIDAAVANYDVVVAQATQEKTTAEAAAVTADAEETAAFEQLVLDLTAFKDEQ